MSSFVSKYAVCPYYHRHNDNRICCEGTDTTNTINLVFESSVEQKRYCADFCYTMCCKGCLVFQMLERKYDDLHAHTI